MKPLKFENPKAEGYRDLLVWQKGIALAKLIYGTRHKPHVTCHF
jgi:hypothetical protein